MLYLEIAKEVKEIYEIDPKKHTAKTKHLFILGDQWTSNHIISTIVKALVLIQAARKNPKQA